MATVWEPDGWGSRARIGLLTPHNDFVPEDEFGTMAPSGVAMHVARVDSNAAPQADDNAVDPLGHGSTGWMQELDAAKPFRHAMHIDVSVAREYVKARLEAAIAPGGRIVDESHAPSWWTLADRAATAFVSAGGQMGRLIAR